MVADPDGVPCDIRRALVWSGEEVSDVGESITAGFVAERAGDEEDEEESEGLVCDVEREPCLRRDGDRDSGPEDEEEADTDESAGSDR